VRNQRGFTLLEVLVATTLMGIAVAGLLSSLSVSVRNASRLTDYDRMTVLAHRKMDEILSSQNFTRFTPVEGRWDPATAGGVDGGWRVLIEPHEMLQQGGGGLMMLDRVELEAWWMSGPQRRKLTLESYRRGVLTSNDLRHPSFMAQGAKR